MSGKKSQNTSPKHLDNTQNKVVSGSEQNIESKSESDQTLAKRYEDIIHSIAQEVLRGRDERIKERLIFHQKISARTDPKLSKQQAFEFVRESVKHNVEEIIDSWRWLQGKKTKIFYEPVDWAPMNSVLSRKEAAKLAKQEGFGLKPKKTQHISLTRLKSVNQKKYASKYSSDKQLVYLALSSEYEILKQVLDNKPVAKNELESLLGDVFVPFPICFGTDHVLQGEAFGEALETFLELGATVSIYFGEPTGRDLKEIDQWLNKHAHYLIDSQTKKLKHNIELTTNTPLNAGNEHFVDQEQGALFKSQIKVTTKQPGYVAFKKIACDILELHVVQKDVANATFDYLKRVYPSEQERQQKIQKSEELQPLVQDLKPVHTKANNNLSQEEHANLEKTRSIIMTKSPLQQTQINQTTQALPVTQGLILKKLSDPQAATSKSRSPSPQKISGGSNSPQELSYLAAELLKVAYNNANSSAPTNQDPKHLQEHFKAHGLKARSFLEGFGVFSGSSRSSSPVRSPSNSSAQLSSSSSGSSSPNTDLNVKEIPTVTAITNGPDGHSPSSRHTFGGR